MSQRTPRAAPIVNLEDVGWAPMGDGGRFAAERKALTVPAGAEKLGASVYRVPPGKAAWPAHRHHANEEAILVLAGEGTLRLDDAEHAVRPGDYIALPAGGPAHQLVNTGEASLEYLCVSTMIVPEVAEYPDSGKLGVFAGAAPGGDKAGRTVYGFYRKDDTVAYYDGEQ